jgi:hypothetical protein
MPQIILNPTEYDSKYIQTDRIYPLIDIKIEELLDKIHKKQFTHTLPLIDESIPFVEDEYKYPLFDWFTDKFEYWLEYSRRNKILGLSKFNRTDIILGCTQYIDNLYMKHGVQNIQILEGEYKYHTRLYSGLTPVKVGSLHPRKILIISAPFPNGSMHPQWNEILDECFEKNIKVHIDGAWITAAKDINLNLHHPCIQSIGISLSKGYGLSGWNRIGLRWTNDSDADSITLMNEYHQIPTLPIKIGIYMLDNLMADHLWDKHESNYYKICADFDLTPTNTIHIGLKNGFVWGIAPLLRYLEYAKTN